MVVSLFSIFFGVVYNLFFEYSIYLIIYNEGYICCLNGKEIFNLYKFCKEVYVLKICDINIRLFLSREGIMFIILFIW